jgi:hypothetical protein
MTMPGAKRKTIKEYGDGKAAEKIVGRIAKFQFPDV